MPRIAINIDALVKDLFAELRLATRQREWTTSFFSTPGVKTERKKSQQVGNCLRFENHGICARLENSRVARIERFANRLIGDASRVEFADVKVVAQEVTGTGSVRGSCSGRQTHQTRSLVDEVAVLGCISTC